MRRRLIAIRQMDGAQYLLSVNRFQFYRKSVRNYSLVRGSAKSASKASRGLMDLPDWRSFAHFLTASKVNLTTEGCCAVASCPDSLTLSAAAACSRSIISSRLISLARFMSSSSFLNRIFYILLKIDSQLTHFQLTPAYPNLSKPCAFAGRWGSNL